MEESYEVNYSRVLVLPVVRNGASRTGGIIVDNIDVDKALS